MDDDENKLESETLDKIDWEENNPYRHIEEANEENYKAEEIKNQDEE